MEKPLINLHKLRNRIRNRIAHLEPVHRRDLLADRQDILTVLGYICPDTRDWYQTGCRIPDTVKGPAPQPVNPLMQPPCPGEELRGAAAVVQEAVTPYPGSWSCRAVRGVGVVVMAGAYARQTAEKQARTAASRRAFPPLGWPEVSPIACE
ncbi:MULTISPECIES: hypothetical protein [Streptomyces]|uniref:hypothetical protein n=1 Tax=Streptomyces TaxID=1883 RepID=UPI00068041D7|nr:MULTISPECIES: hypothetical protein [Streptomyces]MCX4506735.1 hypothetical protein [Streptomyces anulatus]WTD30671.1 hypothetical protein OH737_39590 [Streptomyces anulatus]